MKLLVADQKHSWWTRLKRRLNGDAQAERLEATMRAIAQQILDRQYEIESGDRYNVLFGMERLAVQDSARLAQDHMSKAAVFWHPHQTLAHALKLAPKGGLALEFGVYSGTTLKLIADERADGRVWGFDSFEGLPEAWRSNFPAGTFGVKELPNVPGAELVVGWFDKSLPGYLASHPGYVDFLHIDCDLYSSTRTVLELVGPRLRPGSVVLFDEFFNYPGWRDHECKAWHEYVERTGTCFRFEAYTANHQQVAMRIIEPQVPAS